GVMAQAVVSPRSIDPPRRRATDVAILAASCVVLVLLAARARPLAGPEVELADLVNPLLRGVDGVELALRFGSLWVVAVIAGVGVLAQRRQLSVELITAGIVAWSLGRALALWYGEHLPPPGIVVSGGGLQEFPVVRV